MKISQGRHHWIAKRALTTPGIRRVAEKRLVSLHVDVFTDRSAVHRADERRAHLRALFERLVDAYRTALETEHSEASARELVHLMANMDFHEHGWTELMEIPGDELDTHYERRRSFFERHGVTRADPLGAFRDEPLPEAPPTPERLAAPAYPNAEPGYADAVYVETPDGEVRVGADQPEPDDVSLAEIPKLAPEIEAKYDVTPSFTNPGDRAESSVDG
ncbi:hypothetical protein BRC72_09865 [Halobacteriales archaeon QH_7_66_36]|nr:MAG: hypothetical protein BRC72_09865 [Halobacteriales archaeon QH_7_66_36]